MLTSSKNVHLRKCAPTSPNKRQKLNLWKFPKSFLLQPSAAIDRKPTKQLLQWPSQWDFVYFFTLWPLKVTRFLFKVCKRSFSSVEDRIRVLAPVLQSMWSITHASSSHSSAECVVHPSHLHVSRQTTGQRCSGASAICCWCGLLCVTISLNYPLIPGQQVHKGNTSIWQGQSVLLSVAGLSGSCFRHRGASLMRDSCSHSWLCILCWLACNIYTACITTASALLLSSFQLT